jgi:hypothetical protein
VEAITAYGTEILMTHTRTLRNQASEVDAPNASPRPPCCHARSGAFGLLPAGRFLWGGVGVRAWWGGGGEEGCGCGGGGPGGREQAAGELGRWSEVGSPTPLLVILEAPDPAAHHSTINPVEAVAVSWALAGRCRSLSTARNKKGGGRASEAMQVKPPIKFILPSSSSSPSILHQNSNQPVTISPSTLPPERATGGARASEDALFELPNVRLRGQGQEGGGGGGRMGVGGVGVCEWGGGTW